MSIELLIYLVRHTVILPISHFIEHLVKIKFVNDAFYLSVILWSINDTQQYIAVVKQDKINEK